MLVLYYDILLSSIYSQDIHIIYVKVFLTYTFILDENYNNNYIQAFFYKF